MPVRAISEWQSAWDVFTNFGNYRPRIHCMQTAEGGVDWPWVIILLVLTTSVVASYLRIMVFWRRCYLAERPEDRVTKLRELAYIFLWCAVCGYAMSMLSFVWPAYRLLAVFLFVLNCYSWKFAFDLNGFGLSFGAKRLARELEESLNARHAELERLVAQRTEELEVARDRAESATQAKSDFLASMSHEIRTPMTAIIGFADLLCEDAADAIPVDDRRRAADSIKRSAESLLSIINDILDLSKVEAGKLQVESIPCSPQRIVEDVVQTLRPVAEGKSVALSLIMHPGVPEAVMTDPTRLRQILMNLCGNAVKFTLAGSVSVAVRPATPAEHPGPGLAFEVRDSGVGLTEEQMSRLFQPFAQGDTSTTRKFGGTGLGLAISKRFAVLLKGDINAVCTPGKGCRFTLTIGAPEAAAPKPAEPALAPCSTLAGRYLLAEDGPDNQRLLKMIITRAGASVDLVENGLRAVEVALAAERAGKPYDLVLMDMQMPELDGFEATARLREQGYARPIIALTASAMSGDREKCLEAGCDDYVSKPVDRGAFLSACAKWSNRRSVAA